MASTHSVRGLRRSLLVGVALVMAGVASTAPAAAADQRLTADPHADLDRAAPADLQAAMQRLPDLRMALISGDSPRARHPEMYIERTSDSPSRVLLRFTTIVMNIGAGPFEVRGSRASATDTVMTTRQRIYDDRGRFTNVATNAIAKYSGDGHDHWHIQEMQRYQLWSTADPDGQTLVGLKTGFCFFDGPPKRTHLPGYDPSRVYGTTDPGCGTRDSLKIVMGLSIGWGDIYPWNIANQWIDVTGVASGDYRLCVTVDPQRFYTESDRSNNQVWSDIRLDTASDPPRVTTLAREWAPCR